MASLNTPVTLCHCPWGETPSCKPLGKRDSVLWPRLRTLQSRGGELRGDLGPGRQARGQSSGCLPCPAPWTPAHGIPLTSLRSLLCGGWAPTPKGPG